MSKKNEKKDQSKLESKTSPEIQMDETEVKDLPELEGAVVLTEEQKRILLREEIRKTNRSDYDPQETEESKKNRKKGVNLKTRKIGSTAATVAALILTVISFLLVYYVMGSGEAGKIIVLGLFVVFPMEIIATIMSIVVFISNIVFMSTGRFSFVVLFNFLLSIGLIALNLFTFYMGVEIMFM